MKIALFTDGIYPYVIGGMQKHSFYLAKYFALNKIKVDLYHIASDSRKSTYLDCFTEEENQLITSILIEYPSVGKIPGHYMREMYTYSKQLYVEYCKRNIVDFIYVQGFAGMYLLEQNERSEIPVAVNFHGLEMFQLAADFKSKLQQFLFRKSVLKCLYAADYVFSLGGQLTKLMEQKGVEHSKIIQIPIGIDETWIRKQSIVNNKPTRFLFIGRYERRKGIEEINFVLTKLKKKADFIFEFIGPIPLEKQIEAENIIYHGSINDSSLIKILVQNSDVLVCPSYSEGMPTVILEAMSSGLAIIASNVGAVSEQVNEKNGILIKPGSVKELELAMLRMCSIEDEELLSMKQHSLSLIEQKFLWDNVIQETIQKITEVIKKNS